MIRKGTLTRTNVFTADGKIQSGGMAKVRRYGTYIERRETSSGTYETRQIQTLSVEVGPINSLACLKSNTGWEAFRQLETLDDVAVTFYRDEDGTTGVSQPVVDVYTGTWNVEQIVADHDKGICTVSIDLRQEGSWS